MLQTTCRIQSGSSGGPIVRWSTGEMLGMVVCNSISTTKNKLYPQLNMAVPVSILKAPLTEYLRTGGAYLFAFTIFIMIILLSLQRTSTLRHSYSFTIIICIPWWKYFSEFLRTYLRFSYFSIF